jgi:hypothetical protein
MIVQVRKESQAKCTDINPNIAKTGTIQSQGAKGEAVVFYCKPLARPDQRWKLVLPNP